MYLIPGWGGDNSLTTADLLSVGYLEFCRRWRTRRAVNMTVRLRFSPKLIRRTNFTAPLSLHVAQLSTGMT